MSVEQEPGWWVTESFPWPRVPTNERWNDHVILDLGNGLHASLVAEIDFDRMGEIDYSKPGQRWPQVPDEVEVGFMDPKLGGLVELEVYPLEEPYPDQVARHVWRSELLPLLHRMAALQYPVS